MLHVHLEAAADSAGQPLLSASSARRFGVGHITPDLASPGSAFSSRQAGRGQRLWPAGTSGTKYRLAYLLLATNLTSDCSLAGGLGWAGACAVIWSGSGAHLWVAHRGRADDRLEEVGKWEVLDVPSARLAEVGTAPRLYRHRRRGQGPHIVGRPPSF